MELPVIGFRKSPAETVEKKLLAQLG